MACYKCGGLHDPAWCPELNKPSNTFTNPLSPKKTSPKTETPFGTTGNSEAQAAATGAAMVGVGAIIAVAAVGIALAAYGAVKLPYEGFRRYLNHKNGLPADSDVNNKKAAKYTAISLGAVAIAAGLAVHHQNELNKRFPSIAVAFNTKGETFVRFNPIPEKAYSHAKQACNQNTGWFQSCAVKMYTEAGNKTCINYGAVVQEHGRFDRKRGLIVTETRHPFYSATNYKPALGDKNVYNACVITAQRDGFPDSFCTNEPFQSSCNF